MKPSLPHIPRSSIIRLALVALAGAWSLACLHGANELLGARALIVMTFINGPGYFDVSAHLSDREKIDCYKREVDDMVKLHATACALDTFDVPANRAHIRLFARAIEEYNDAHPGTNFGYFLLLDLPPRAGPSPWANLDEVEACFNEIRNPYYATHDGEWVIATWHGEQFAPTWWKQLNDRFVEHEGAGVFIYNNFYPREGRSLVDNIRELTDQGLKTAYYDFVTWNDQNFDANIALQRELDPLAVSVACGIRSSFWAICSTKPNSGRYVDGDGFGWMMRLFDRLLDDQEAARFPNLWITIWSDFGEDNFFIPTEDPPPFHRNPVIPPWTHRGFYKLLQYYTAWWRTGKEPRLHNEALYWCYRQHPKGLASAPGDQCDESRYLQTRQFLPTWEEARDAIYVVTRLNEPGSLVVTLGDATYEEACPAGLQQHRIDWNANRGQPRFELRRGGNVVIKATGTLAITDDPRGLDGSFTRNMHMYADYAETPQ